MRNIAEMMNLNINTCVTVMQLLSFNRFHCIISGSICNFTIISGGMDKNRRKWFVQPVLIRLNAELNTPVKNIIVIRSCEKLITLRH